MSSLKNLTDDDEIAILTAVEAGDMDAARAIFAKYGVKGQLPLERTVDLEQLRERNLALCNRSRR